MKKATSKQKEALRNGAGIAVRPVVPDDVNHMRQYPTWKPGQLRPFVPQFSFGAAPSTALAKGAGRSPSTKENAAFTMPNGIKTPCFDKK